MKMNKKNWSILLGVGFVALIASLFYVRSLGEPESKSIAFITIGIDQNVLTTEVSSYEIQRASEHFSDVVLGWTVEPGFSSELNEKIDGEYSLSGQRQEKQNLIFTVSGSSELVNSSEEAEQLVELIQSRIDEYNNSTNAAYVIAVKSYSYLDGDRSESRLVAGFVLVVLVFTYLLLTLWGYAASSRRRS